MRSRILGILVLSVTWSSLVCSQQIRFDRERLEKLLQSDRIMELRAAAKMIAADPEQSAIFVGTVMKRANHPELTQAFEALLPRCSDQQLSNLLSVAGERQQTMIRSEIDLRSKSPGPPNATVPRRAAPMAGTTGTPAGSTPDRGPPESAPPMSRQGRAQAVIEERRDTYLKNSLNNNRLRVGDADASAKLDQLVARPTDQPLSDFEWDLVFWAFEQQQLPKSSGDPSVGSRGGRIVSSRLRLSPDRVIARFNDPKLTNPRPYFLPLKFLVKEHPEICEGYWLWISNRGAGESIRLQAIREFPFAQESMSQYVEAFTQLAETDQGSIRRALLQRMEPYAYQFDVATQDRLFSWLIDQNEKWIGETSFGSTPVWKRVGVETSSIQRIFGSAGAKAQQRHVGHLVAAVKSSQYPFHFLFILEGFRCDLSEAEPLVRGLYQESREPHERLVYARILYKVAGKDSGVANLFRSALRDQRATDQLRLLAIRGVETMGPDAADLLPDLINLLASSNDYLQRMALLDAIKTQGTAAVSATDAIVKTLWENAEFQLHVDGMDVLEKIGAPADKALPLLVDTSLDPRGRFAKVDTVRSLALFYVSEYGKDAVEYLPKLQPLIRSTNRKISGAATRTIETIERARQSS